LGLFRDVEVRELFREPGIGTAGTDLLERCDVLVERGAESMAVSLEEYDRSLGRKPPTHRIKASTQ